MADYLKLNIKWSNFGLNLTHDPSTLPFGKFGILDNALSFFEGSLQARPGQKKGNPTAIPSANVIGFRRLNNSVTGNTQYIIRAADALLASNDTSIPFTITELEDGFSGNYGSIIIYRPTISANVWAYIFDEVKMVKTDGTTTQFLGYPRPHSESDVVGGDDFSAAVGGAGGDLTASETYEYRFSLYNSTTGAESLYNLIPDGAITDEISASTTGTNFNINVTLPDLDLSADEFDGIDFARIYRTGGTIATWRLVDTVAYTGTSLVYNDDLADAAIAVNALQDENSDQPFTTTQVDGTDLAGQPLPYASDPYLGYILAVGDPLNPGYLYWTNKFDPERQDPDNRVEVTSPQDPLMNVFLYNGRPYVFSMEGLYELFIGLEDNATFTPSKTSCNRGLFAPHGFCVGPEIYFISKDGIYATSGGVERSLTDDELRPLFQGVESAYGTYNALDFEEPSYMRMAFFNNELWFQYRDVDNTTHYLVYDVRYKRWRNCNFRTDTQSIYADEETTSQLWFGSVNGYLFQHSGTSDEGGTPTTIPVEIATGSLVFGAALINKEFGQLILDVDPKGSTMTIVASMNNYLGTLNQVTATTSSATRTKVFMDLDSTVAEDLILDVQWASSSATPIIYGYELLYRKDEPEVTAWAVNNVTHGLEGWQILRSAYIALVADGTVLFHVDNIQDDGSLDTNTYTLTPDAVELTKLFVPFLPTKGKSFNYRFECGTATSFRLYPDQCEIHAKPWITAFGYRRSNPFASSELSAQDQEGVQNPSLGDSSEGGLSLNTKEK